MSAFVCSSPLSPVCGFLLSHSRRTGLQAPASHRSRATPAFRTDNLATLRMDMIVNNVQTPATQEMFPIKPRAAVAVAACRFSSSGSMEWLLIQRGKEPSYGEWSLPGGSVELGETTMMAAKRELQEETCIGDQQASFFAHSFMTSDAIVRDIAGRMLFHYVIAQTFAVIERGVEPRACDDAMDARWFNMEEIRTQQDVTAGVAAVVERAERLWKAGCLEVDGGLQ
eukprot:CAMPEP_0181295044 /NCGR_PEP_ID=MMETSP1101-20121128/3928_1 /TAXON_ID=46948 /ORGANISM="Rhodomonas abbreviata, Strain Caron Lab Isolate" /LENGTH=225 /DNA_ID=CAMNT_0023399751 /DNA_START=274 /DNA_END=951 /DNA_ORIENTATION=+